MKLRDYLNLSESYELDEVRGFGGHIPKGGTTYGPANYPNTPSYESPSRQRRQKYMNSDFSSKPERESAAKKVGIRSRYASGSQEQQPDIDAYRRARGTESGLSMSPARRAELAAKRAERQGQGKRASKIRARMAGPGVSEELEVILDYLLDEGYCNSYESAAVIYENMSDHWIRSILG